MILSLLALIPTSYAWLAQALVQTPPLVKEAPKPAAPSRIRVGCRPQAAYSGPLSQWLSDGKLSDATIVELETKLSINPQDTCARGHLIAHGNYLGARRMDHVLWMIENRPEWDGFLLNFSFPRTPDEERDYDRAKAAWLQQAGPDQRNAMALFHAAVFFAGSEPEFGLSLLERAVSLEPGPGFLAERLGAMYGHLWLRSKDATLVSRAKSTLLTSQDWTLVAGALNVVGFGKTADVDIGKALRARLSELTGEPIRWDFYNKLPSRSAQHTRPSCDPVPLITTRNECKE